jgi:hypothetical protein
MFEHRNSGEIEWKEEETFFFENLRRPYKDLIQVKKIQNYLMLVYLQNDHGEKILKISQKGRNNFIYLSKSLHEMYY